MLGSRRTFPLVAPALYGKATLKERPGRVWEDLERRLEDNLVAPDRGRELAKLVPGAELELVPACGHLLTTDAEEQVAGAILAHLESSAGAVEEEPGYAA